MREHHCPLPNANQYPIGHLHLCECERLYVVRSAWVDAVCPVEVHRWDRVTRRRWWRR